jgi:hypothetical protein
MEELENNANGKVRTNDELRSGIDQGIADVQNDRAESWDAALQRQNRERNAQNGMATYGQMQELVGRRELAEIQNGQKAQDAIASALAIAQQNGGRLPGVVREYLNRQFGFDGQTMGIMDGGIDQQTGEFGFVFGERDNAGNMKYRKQMIPLSAQLGLMEGYPSLFNEDAVKAHRQRMLDSGLSSGEVDAYSNVAKLARDRMAARIAELSPKPAGGWSPERVALENRRLDLRDNEEKGRNARAGSKNDTANARLAASIAKNMSDIKRGLKLNDEQAAQFQTSLTKILSDAFGSPAGQEGGEEQPFKELSREEYAALSPEEQKKYRETWKNWKTKQSK